MENNIKELRKSMGLSQDELAKLCNVSRQTINAIENNKYDPTLELAFRLAEVLNSTVDRLFKYKANKNNKA
jgi:putative transcriptional regulator